MKHHAEPTPRSQIRIHPMLEMGCRAQHASTTRIRVAGLRQPTSSVWWWMHARLLLFVGFGLGFGGSDFGFPNFLEPRPGGGGPGFQVPELLETLHLACGFRG